KIETRNSKIEIGRWRLETGSARSFPVSHGKLASPLLASGVVNQCAFTGSKFRFSIFDFRISILQFPFSSFLAPRGAPPPPPNPEREPVHQLAPASGLGWPERVPPSTGVASQPPCRSSESIAESLPNR